MRLQPFNFIGACQFFVFFDDSLSDLSGPNDLPDAKLKEFCVLRFPYIEIEI